MPSDVDLRCACGSFRGVLRGAVPGSGNRAVCYCDDCQAYAHFLERADEVLDPHGGTDVFQTSPARVRIGAGRERLACMRLRPDGILRWYTACCRTPVGNTLATRSVPFVGVIRRCMDLEPDRVDATLGPVRMRAFRRFARGDAPRTPAPAFAASVLRFGGIVLAARLRGDHLRSPFFAPDGSPAVPPQVLDPEALDALLAHRSR